MNENAVCGRLDPRFRVISSGDPLLVTLINRE